LRDNPTPSTDLEEGSSVLLSKANPKSPIFTFPSPSRKILAGLVGDYKSIIHNG